MESNKSILHTKASKTSGMNVIVYNVDAARVVDDDAAKPCLDLTIIDRNRR